MARLGEMIESLNPPPDKAHELALAAAYYAAARQEIIARIAQRDQALTLYLAAAGVIASAAVSDLSERWPMLFVVPFLASGAAFVLSRHNDVIGALGRFLEAELGGWVRNKLPEAPPHWDGSRTLRELWRDPLVSRLVGQLFLIPGTAGACLVVAVAGGASTDASVPALVPAALAGVAGVCLSAAAIERSYKRRAGMMTVRAAESTSDNSGMS